MLELDNDLHKKKHSFSRFRKFRLTNYYHRTERSIASVLDKFYDSRNSRIALTIHESLQISDLILIERRKCDK